MLSWSAIEEENRFSDDSAGLGKRVTEKCFKPYPVCSSKQIKVPCITSCTYGCTHINVMIET